MSSIMRRRNGVIGLGESAIALSRVVGLAVLGALQARAQAQTIQACPAGEDALSARHRRALSSQEGRTAERFRALAEMRRLPLFVGPNCWLSPVEATTAHLDPCPVS